MKNSGQLFLIVGNSGSGKDSLLEEVMARWPASAGQLRIPRRYITRPAHKSEPFIAVTAEEFETLKQDGEFYLSWHVYDTHYGVPVTIINWLQQGDAVIVNVSRAIIPQARQMIPGLKVIFVSVPLETTLQRIKSRNRESLNDPGFKQRLARAQENQTLADADFVVDNSGSLETAAEELLCYMLSFTQ
jgi:phosphonate metabolism protein PhnN/1,5-bisphosphokinase (PRPP-forming)